MAKLTRIRYEKLNARQQENYNFQKVAARLADFGFNCLRLTDDWEGADFIACHVDGETFLKVQLKGRLTIAKKYKGKSIHIAFIEGGKLYLYPHDEVLDKLLEKVEKTKSWKKKDGQYDWPSLSEKNKNSMEPFAVYPTKSLRI